MTKKLYIKNSFGILLLLFLSVFSLFVGVNKLSIGHFFQNSSIEWKIIITTRLPRTISLILAGATLALSGLLMQRSEEHTSELQSRGHIVYLLLLEQKKMNT